MVTKRVELGAKREISSLKYPYLLWKMGDIITIAIGKKMW
jgi:hypothetical protein